MFSLKAHISAIMIDFLQATVALLFWDEAAVNGIVLRYILSIVSNSITEALMYSIRLSPSLASVLSLASKLRKEEEDVVFVWFQSLSSSDTSRLHVSSLI